MLKIILDLVVILFLVGTATTLFANWLEKHSNDNQ